MQAKMGMGRVWPSAISVMLLLASHLVSAELASFNGGFLDNLTGGLDDFDGENGGDLLQLVRRQQRYCPAYAPVDCGASGGCCRSGEYCCTNVNGCCPVDSNCYSNPRGCCPKSAETCNKGFCLLPGQTCCGPAACNKGYMCMKSPSGRETCCLPGMTACNDGSCCYEGTTCSASNPGKCERIRTSISTLSESLPSRSARPTSQPNPTRPPTTATSPVKSQKPPKMKCKSTPSYSIPNAKRTAIPELAADHVAAIAAGAPHSKRQEESGSAFAEFCETEDEKIPVMLFPWFPGETDELIESTCGGIRQFGGTDELLLTWAGDGPTAAGKRRAKNCPSGYCSSIGQKQNANYARENECDEFPPASTVESAQGSHVMCIDRLQNQLGGKLILSYRWIYRLQPNQKFIIRVIPNCNYFAKHKRSPSSNDVERVQKRAETDAFSGSGGSWLQDRRPGAEMGVGWVFGSLPELSAGAYNISFDFKGAAKDLSVFDSAGLEYLRLESSEPGQSFNFTVAEGLPLAVAAYAREDAKIDLSYSGKRMPNSTTKPSLAVSVRSSWDFRSMGLGFLILALLTFFM
ncbi:uncharacterized protein EI97DRAFT_214470 [Westerdykella ornata]|uniref:Deoxyribonuclease NucA/NucB domain-containing protein n=1 Tax=Westerdykella ornata TaxID=318751 RepID=A0A6A6JPL0_WESOR|nr:uncharacterized protein EI97DRAFT_214470 [Westerdykella ornata]KAF2278590.1 hypothetical protein EI97DRAFT_214470 [Westerdykella ornata]